MKRIKKAREFRRLRIAHRRKLRELYRRTKSGRGQQITSLKAPRVFRFTTNGDRTIRFLKNLRRAATEQRRTLRNGKWIWPNIQVDLSTIREISIPAAVVLSAEFQRWSLLKEVQLRPHRVKAWDARVRKLFSDLGMFELLGINEAKATSFDGPELVLLRLMSGTKNEGEKIAALLEGLRSLGVIFDRKSYIFDGLCEAVSNCIDHAYSQADPTDAIVPRVGLRWWATSCYDATTDSLRFFVFDQGVGISATLVSQKEWLPLIANMLKEMLAAVGLKKPDCDIISAAFEVGRTRTDRNERGKGLDQMASVVRQVGSGSIRVLSGRGDVRIDAAGKCIRRELNSNLGGTLIEWNLPYAALRGQIGDGSQNFDS